MAVDRATIYLGESLLLTIEVDGEVLGISPDIGQITRDFVILESNRSAQTQTINGKKSTKNQWLYEIEPKRDGTLPIPPMRVGEKLTTEPLSVTVLPRADAATADDDIFIEISVDPKNPYVQAQVRYTERLFYAIPLREGSLNRTTVTPDIEMERLGEDLTYVAERNGRSYRVMERNYALFALKSGALTLPDLVFRGRTARRSQTRTDRDVFVTRGERIEITGPTHELQVRPRPASFSGERWLPSSSLTLRESWSEDPQRQFRVGEPITRTIRLQARGLRENQLPELAVPDVAQARTYLDPPVNQSRHDDNWLIAEQEQRLAIVPTAAGRYHATGNSPALVGYCARPGANRAGAGAHY